MNEIEKSEEHFHCENLQLSVNFINTFFTLYDIKIKSKYFRNFIHESPSGIKYIDVRALRFELKERLTQK